jgi:hypothetical protein
MGTKHLIIIVVFIIIKTSLLAKTYHVTPSAKANGAGTIDDPTNFQTLIDKNSTVQYGDTILLHAGTYYGSYTCYINYYKKNTEDGPVVIRPYKNDVVIFDGIGNDIVGTINDYGKIRYLGKFFYNQFFGRSPGY